MPEKSRKQTWTFDTTSGSAKRAELSATAETKQAIREAAYPRGRSDDRSVRDPLHTAQAVATTRARLPHALIPQHTPHACLFTGMCVMAIH